MRWKPKVRETYYVVAPACIVNSDTSKNDWYDKLLYKSGNCFRTRKQAEQAAVKVRKLLLSLQKEKI